MISDTPHLAPLYSPLCHTQVFYRNRWGLVGAEGWSQLNSKVVCGQMGYCGAEETRVVDETSSHFNFSAAVRGDRPFFWMKGVSCLGGEALLKDCRHFDFKAYYRLPAAKVRCLKTCETYYQNGTKVSVGYAYMDVSKRLHISHLL